MEFITYQLLAMLFSRRSHSPQAVAPIINDQPRPQGLLLDDVQNGGSSGEGPGKG